MPIRYSIYNIVKEASNADFDNEIYYAVYSTSGATATINGVSTTLPAGIIIRRSITSISATSDVYVIGDKDYSVDAPTTISKYPEPTPPEPIPDRDVDVQAFLDATGIADSDIITALETFVETLKTESLWDKMVGLYPLITDKTDTADIQGQFKYNLKDPQDTDAAYRLTFNGSLGLSNQGITSMGGGNWIDTHISSAGVFTDDRPTFGYSNTSVPSKGRFDELKYEQHIAWTLGQVQKYHNDFIGKHHE